MSSIKSGISKISFETETRLSKSFSTNFLFLYHLNLCETAQIKFSWLIVQKTFLKKKIELMKYNLCFVCIAAMTYAIFVANEVFPIDGLPAIMLNLTDEDHQVLHQDL